jgi:hypothetical protein
VAGEISQTKDAKSPECFENSPLMSDSNFESRFWKSACWIRRISDPVPAMTTLMDSAKRYRVDTEKLKKPWPRNSS